MALKFTNTNEAALNGVKCLVSGPSGVGKTVLCGTAPNPVIISAEKGLLSLRKKSILAIEVTNVFELGEAYEWCTKSKEAQQYWTICLDSISEMAEVVLAHLMKTVGAKDPRKAFGELIPQMATVIRMFRDIPQRHVVLTAKLEQQKDEMTGGMLYMPSMPGQKLGPQLPYFFDEVFTMRIGKDTNGQSFRYVQTQPDLQYVAKDRSGELAGMEQPDLQVIFNKILGVK